MMTKFIFQELERRYPLGWLGAKKPGPGRGRGEVITKLTQMGVPLSERMRSRLERTSDVAELLDSFHLKSIRLDSQLGLLGFLRDDYPLTVRHDIPTPGEMLESQCQGRRFLSLLLKSEERDTPIGRHAGAFEFLLHDLEHAHKFFGDPERFRGQVAFFRFLSSRREAFRIWQHDALFMQDLNYLMSDMNSHPAHLFRYLKAIVLTATLRKLSHPDEYLDLFWLETLSDWDSENLAAALRINHPERELADDIRVITQRFVQCPLV